MRRAFGEPENREKAACARASRPGSGEGRAHRDRSVQPGGGRRGEERERGRGRSGRRGAGWAGGQVVGITCVQRASKFADERAWAHAHAEVWRKYGEG